MTESAAFGLGTLAGSAGYLAIPLMGVGIFIALLASGNRKLTFVGTFTAIAFAVGVGLPGASPSAAGQRLWLSLAGGLWALLGAWFHKLAASKRVSGAASGALDPLGERLRHYFTPARWGSDEFRYAVAVGVASSAGIAVGFILGLPRDFWIVVTIIFAMRPRLGPTLSATAMIVVGTLVGAALAAAITLGVSDPILLEILMFAFAVSLFSTRGVNFGLVQASFTPFVIILLNLLYPGEWQLAEVRILAVAIGGAIAVATVYLAEKRKIIGDVGRGLVK